MTVSVNLTNEQEILLRKQADARGVAAEVVLRDIVDAALSLGKATGLKQPAQRVVGLHADSIRHIADDFDDELPDSFWSSED